MIKHLYHYYLDSSMEYLFDYGYAFWIENNIWCGLSRENFAKECENDKDFKEFWNLNLLIESNNILNEYSSDYVRDNSIWEAQLNKLKPILKSKVVNRFKERFKQNKINE